MQKIRESLVLRKDDYAVIMALLKQGLVKNSFNHKEAELLQMEIKKARLVNSDELPTDVVRLNSIVTIKEEKENKVMVVKVVTPENADIRQKKISVLSPIGTALLGFRKGKSVKWNVPAGKKTFTILDVVNVSDTQPENQEEP
jgi:regulator of nucleoside diphosphate kinase